MRKERQVQKDSSIVDHPVKHIAKRVVQGAGLGMVFGGSGDVALQGPTGLTPTLAIPLVIGEGVLGAGMGALIGVGEVAGARRRLAGE